jgi:integrase
MPSQTDAPVKASETKPPAQDPELEDLMEEALGYHESALSENTRRAYERGWKDFAEFCLSHDLPTLPATEQAVALFLTDRARRLSTSTLDQRLAAIQHVHDRNGEESPTRSKSVRDVMRGIRRESDETPRQAKPLLTEDVKAMVRALPTGSEDEPVRLRALRNRALLLVGFAGAFRRSEIRALHKRHVEERQEGIILTLPESKTDQAGEGQLVAIRRVGGDYCPVGALKGWTAAASIEEGPLFRGVRQNGSLRPQPNTRKTGGNIVRSAAEAEGHPSNDRVTGHSRRGGQIERA